MSPSKFMVIMVLGGIFPSYMRCNMFQSLDNPHLEQKAEKHHRPRNPKDDGVHHDISRCWTDRTTEIISQRCKFHVLWWTKKLWMIRMEQTFGTYQLTTIEMNDVALGDIIKILFWKIECINQSIRFATIFLFANEIHIKL